MFKLKIWILQFAYQCVNALIIGKKSVTDGALYLNKFSLSSSCRMSDRINEGCAGIQPGKFRSIVECAVNCKEDNCMGVTIDDNQVCYIHQECSQYIILTDCGLNELEFKLYIRDVPCQHRGVFNEISQSCQCRGGWVGKYCQRLPISCQELVAYGYMNDTLWTYIQINSNATPFRVICNLHPTFVTSRLMHNTGLLKSNRTWQDFVHGFYIDKNNFWIGLNQMKLLNTQDLNILCSDVQFGMNSGYNLFSYRYLNFSLSDNSSGYSFSFLASGYTGVGTEYDKYKMNFISCLDNLQNVQFSTWDNDVDGEDSQNCAAMAGSGWWYKTCDVKCTPLGKISQWLPITGLDLVTANYAESIIYFTTA